MLVVLVQPAEEVLTLQGVDGGVNHLDHRGMAILRKRLESFGVRSPDSYRRGVP